jgi:phosphoribosyl 1,2-cyclic phosphodiesterase
LHGLSKYKNLEFFANENIGKAIENKHEFNIPWQRFSTSDRFQFNDLKVASFTIPHDDVDPIGCVFSIETNTDTDGKKYGLDDRRGVHSILCVILCIQY